MARPSDMHHWARLGAAARLKHIQQELAEIYRAFPDLRRHSGAVAAAAPTGRKRARFSAAGREAISEGMRKYWARRKALEKAAARQ